MSTGLPPEVLALFKALHAATFNLLNVAQDVSRHDTLETYICTAREAINAARNPLGLNSFASAVERMSRALTAVRAVERRQWPPALARQAVTTDGYPADVSDPIVALAQRQAAQIARLVEALGKYGRHPEECPLGVGVGYYTPAADAACTCGIAAALASVDAPLELAR